MRDFPLAAPVVEALRALAALRRDLRLLPLPAVLAAPAAAAVPAATGRGGPYGFHCSTSSRVSAVSI